MALSAIRKCGSGLVMLGLTGKAAGETELRITFSEAVSLAKVFVRTPSAK